MKHNSRSLAMRDPALAALMGGISGSDFGADASFGEDFGFGFGDDYGDDDGDDYGADFGAVARPVVPRPTAAAAMAAWQKHHAGKARARSRVVKLDPNKDSPVKVERYSFSLSQVFALGTTAAFDNNMSGTPDTDFRPQVITTNAPAPGFALISNIKMANVNVTVGPGSEDAYNYSAAAWGKSLDMPTLTPSNRATISGSYTGFVPPGYVLGASFTFGLNFKGPALLAGGGAI